MYRKTNNNGMNFNDKLNSFKKPQINFTNDLVIYGAGDMCKMALQFFNLYKIKPNLIIDKKVKKLGKVRVSNISKLKNLNKNVNICICISNKDFFLIYNQLKSKGFKRVFHFYDFSERLKGIFYLTNGWFVNKKTKLKKKIKFSQNFFEDEISIKSYINFLMWHVNRNYITDFKPHKKIYFNKITKKFLLKKELFYLDIGTGYGKSLSKLLTIKKSYKVLCIDGCKKVTNYLKNKYKFNNKIKILNKVISNKKKKIKFHEGLYHISKISKNGTTVFSHSIDSLKIKPSIIKIHTEGEELNVLKGTLKTINLHSPLLMINIYHNSDGVFKIFKLMNKFHKKYKFYLRGYSSVGTNYVLYCIPKQS